MPISDRGTTNGKWLSLHITLQFLDAYFQPSVPRRFSHSGHRPKGVTVCPIRDRHIHNETEITHASIQDQLLSPFRTMISDSRTHLRAKHRSRDELDDDRNSPRKVTPVQTSAISHFPRPRVENASRSPSRCSCFVPIPVFLYTTNDRDVRQIRRRLALIVPRHGQY